MPASAESGEQKVLGWVGLCSYSGNKSQVMCMSNASMFDKWHWHYIYLCAAKTSKKSRKKQHAHHISTTFDYAHLTFGHHQAIIASLALLPCLQKHYVGSSSPPSGRPEQSGKEKGGPCKGKFGETGSEGHRMDLLVIGLGGGALPMFVNKYIPNVSCLFLYRYGVVSKQFALVCLMYHTSFIYMWAPCIIKEHVWDRLKCRWHSLSLSGCSDNILLTP